MKNVYVLADSIISPLGFSAAENFNSLLNDQSGLQKVHITTEDCFSYASFLNKSQIGKLSAEPFLISRFERLMYTCIADIAAKNKVDFSSAETIFIFATTKGNIELIPLPDIDSYKLNIFNSVKKITQSFGNTNNPIVISNACISGSAALIFASRLIREGYYKNAVVCGADTVNDFVLSGFQSLKALSANPCKPFDKERTGVNLGEAAACVVLSSEKANFSQNTKIYIQGGAVTNDANHISGPSRTGQELALAIQKALNESGITQESVDFISAHGTATDFNDEMESKALYLSGIDQKPINSLKAYFGHTLGAAGLLESIVSIHSLCNNTVIRSKGFETCGTSHELNIAKNHLEKHVSTALKTIAGFGGCNAALIIKKDNS